MKKIVILLIIFNSQLLTFNSSDPFWQENQPGNLWNCKCDWEETDAPIDTKELKADDLAKARKEGGGIHANGLEGNPAVTGEIFTQGCTYFKNVSRTKAKKLEHYAGDKLLRKESIRNLHGFQGKNPIKIDKMGEEIEVTFDSKTTSHISNDIANSENFLWNEISSNIQEVLKNGTLVAHEQNAKSGSKPSAQHYYYYECNVGNNKFYLHVEENFVERENRHFFRLYSITEDLRPTAILY